MPTTVHLFRRAMLGVLAAAAAALPARTQSVLGLVRAPGGAPIAGAWIAFWPDGALDPPWRERIAQEPVVGFSDAAGRFNLAAPRGSGCLLVEHPRDGGASFPHCWTGVPVSVVLRPLGTVQVRDATDALLRLRVLGPDGTSVRIADRRGARIPLAAGEYLALVEVDGRLAERSCSVAPGAELTIEPPPERPPRTVADDRRSTLVLPRWPDVALRQIDGRVELPATSGQGRVRELLETAGGTAFAEHAYDGSDALVRLPELAVAWRAIELRDAARDGMPLAGATVLSVARAGRTLRIRSRSRSGPDGVAHVLAPHAAAPCTAIVWREGCAPWMQRQPLPERVAVALEPARSLRIRVATPDPMLAEGATVRIEQPPWDLVPRTELANERGEVVFVDLAAAETMVFVEHPEFLPTQQTIDLGAPDAPEKLVVELAPGLVLHGAVLVEGEPAVGAVVELRDASGLAGSTTRIVAAAADGTFRIRGLADEAFTLFAHREGRGTTWSRRISGATPAGSPYRIELVPEDPPLPGRRD